MSFRSHAGFEKLAGDRREPSVRRSIARRVRSGWHPHWRTRPHRGPRDGGRPRQQRALEDRWLFGSRCRSVNDKPFTGFPGWRLIQPGDLVKLSGPGSRIGFSARPRWPSKREIGRETTRAAPRVPSTERAWQLGIQDRPRRRAAGSAIGPARACSSCASHEVVTSPPPIHEPPKPPNDHDDRPHGRLIEGLVTIDRPIIAAASGRVVI